MDKVQQATNEDKSLIPLKLPTETAITCEYNNSNTFCRDLVRYNFIEKVLPVLKSSTDVIPKKSIDEYNEIYKQNISDCSHVISTAHSIKYEIYKNKIYSELTMWIQSLPKEVQQSFNLNIIQPNQIIMFMNQYYIPSHGKITDKSEGKKVLSYSAIKTVIGCISSVLSLQYFRVNKWSIQNMRGNPCKSEMIRIYKKYSKTYLQEISKGPIVSSPISMREVFTIVRDLDNYMERNLTDSIIKRSIPKIVKKLLIHRDISYYLYLFITCQRGGEGCLIKVDNCIFNKNRITEVVESIEVTIPSYETKNRKQNKILICRNAVFGDATFIEDYEKDKYCFINRYLKFLNLCEMYKKYLKHFQQRTVIFPNCNRNKQIDFQVVMTRSSALCKFRANLKSCKLDRQLNYLTLHSFRRGSCQNYKDIGENKRATKQRANFSESMYKHYTNKNLKTRKDVYKHKHRIDEAESDSEGEDCDDFDNDKEIQSVDDLDLDNDTEIQIYDLDNTEKDDDFTTIIEDPWTSIQKSMQN